MIALDFGILFSLKAEVEDQVFSSRSFSMRLSRASRVLLNRYDGIFKLEEDKFDRTVDSIGRVFTSGLLASFNESLEDINGETRTVNKITTINEKIVISILVYLNVPSLASSINIPNSIRDLPQFDGLSTNFKWTYYMKLEDQTNPVLLDQSNILALAPSVLTFPKQQLETLTYERNNRTISSSREDDLSIQFDLGNRPEGIYQAKLTTPNSTKNIYAGAGLYSNPPFAIVEVTVPAGNFALKEYEIKFEKKQ